MRNNDIQSIVPATPKQIAEAMEKWQRTEIKAADVLKKIEADPSTAVVVTYAKPRRPNNVKYFYTNLDGRLEVIPTGEPGKDSGNRHIFNSFIIRRKPDESSM